VLAWISPQASPGATSKLNIIPLLWCSAMWQWAIHNARAARLAASQLATALQRGDLEV
jgi:hypothetical protein